MVRKIFKLKSNAMSLLELMVVIAIIGASVAVATPIYTSYMTRSRVAAAIPTLGGLERVAKTQYEARSTATSIVFGSTTFANNTVTAIDIPPVVNGLYVRPGGMSGVDDNSFLVCVYVDDLLFAGYAPPTPGAAGTYSRLCRMVTARDTIYTNRCGALDGSNNDIPLEYLPGGCTCANVLTGAC